MSWLWGVLVGFLLYWGAVAGLNRLGYFPDSVSTQGPIITVHTRRGRALLDWIGRPRRFWRAWGNFGIGVALVVMASMFLVVVNSAIASMLTSQRTQITEPRNVLVIPGVNDFLPLSAAPEIVFGLVVGLVVHEGGHGLLCRVEDIEIESMGVALLAFIPLGAFVQPDHDSQQSADRGSRTRMFAAGVMNNFVVTLLGFALLFWLVSSTITVAPGAAVAQSIDGSGAATAGIGPGDRIVGVDGQAIESDSELDDYLEGSSERTVEVALASGDAVQVERSLMVVAAVPDGPAGLDLEETVEAIDGEPVYTQAEFEEAARDSAVLTVEANGASHRFPVGAYVPRVDGQGPLGQTGIESGEHHYIVITALDDERIVSSTDASAFLEETSPGETVSVTAYVYPRGEAFPEETSPETVEVTLGEHPSAEYGFLGVAMQPGMTGLSLNDFGTQYYPAGLFLATLGGQTEAESLFQVDSFFGKVFSALVLPIASFLGPGLEQNFPGFTGYVANFYEVHGPLGVLGPTAVFLASNLLFWTAWINLNLGIFNCIPAFPLDGGHLLRSSTESVVARLPVDNPYMMVKYVTISVGVMMLLGLVLMLFGQGLLV